MRSPLPYQPAPAQAGGRGSVLYGRGSVLLERLNNHRGIKRFSRAFTMIELLVVISIILVLLGAVLVAGNSILTSAKVRNTRAVLQLVDSALDEFQRQRPSILGAKQDRVGGGKVRYSKRYGSYPPDEVEMFTTSGLPGSTGGSLSVGMAEFVPAPDGGYSPMKFYTAGNTDKEIEHRDLIAMLLAIDMYCEPAAMILSQVPDANRSRGVLDPSGDPLQFLDRPGGAAGIWDVNNDEQIPNLIVDSWGMPLSYFSQRDYTPDVPNIASLNAVADWNQASTEMIRLNKGRPIIMSYGPDGKDQLTEDAQTAPAPASLVGDWEDGRTPSPRIDNPFNEDNVYVDETLNERLAEGL